MDWLDDPDVWTILSSSLAQRYRVLPLGRDADRIRLLAGDNFTGKQKQEVEAALEFHLGAAVSLEGLENHQFLELGGFNELLDKYYSFPYPAELSQPVSTDLMTVLLIDDKKDRLQKWATALRQKGYRVIEATSCDDALADLKKKKNACCPKKIVVARQVFEKQRSEFEILAKSLNAELIHDLPKEILIPTFV